MTVNVVEKVSNRLTGQRATSEETRRHLEKFGRLLAPDDNLTVQFSSKIPTAVTRADRIEEGLLVEVTDKKIEQPETDIDNDAWQLLAREALLIHEIGHVLYTDFEAYKDVLDTSGLSKQEKQEFDKIQNALEDAVVDQQLRWKFNCGRELDTHLLNLFSKGKAQQRYLGFIPAVTTAILEKGVYSVGILEEYHNGERDLIDAKFEDEFEEALELIDDVLTDVLTEPDAMQRYERCLDFYLELKDLEPSMSGWKGDDLETSLPQDMQETDTGSGEAADQLDDVDEEALEEMLKEAEGKPEEDEEEGADHSHGEPSDEGDEEDEDSLGHGEEETDERDGEGRDERDGSDAGGDHPYPAHEGHSLVLKD